MSARVKAAKNAAVRCRCRGCHHDLGMYRWTATAPDDGRFVEVVAGERMSFGTPARRGERTGTGLFVEVFEGRVYQRIDASPIRSLEIASVHTSAR